MRSIARFASTTLVLVSAIGLHPSADAVPLAAGKSLDDGLTFQLTSSAGSHLVSNPVGPVENRAAVEFDISDAAATGNNLFEEARLVLRATIESNKDLTVYAYSGDGQITPDDFGLGLPIGTLSLIANPGVLTEIEFNLHDYLIELGGTYPNFLGFNLRESESPGGVVVLEYLVLGTFLNVSLAVPQTVPEPATLSLVGLGLAGFAWSRRPRTAS